MSFVTQLLAALAVAFFNALMARADLVHLTQAQDREAVAKVDAAALNWLVVAQRDPARWATLASLPGGARLTGGFTPDPDPPVAGPHGPV